MHGPHAPRAMYKGANQHMRQGHQTIQRSFGPLDSTYSCPLMCDVCDVDRAESLASEVDPVYVRHVAATCDHNAFDWKNCCLQFVAGHLRCSTLPKGPRLLGRQHTVPACSPHPDRRKPQALSLPRPRTGSLRASNRTVLRHPPPFRPPSWSGHTPSAPGGETQQMHHHSA
jgi:hypothetical protein